MERKYYRQYENYDRIIPRVEDFPILPIEDGNTVPEPAVETVRQEQQVGDTAQTASRPVKMPGGLFHNFSLKADDIIILALIVMMLMEEERDDFTIIMLAIVFLSEYLF